MRRVLIAGATGFIGRELGLALARRGIALAVLTRRPEAACAELPYPCRIYGWNGTLGSVPPEALDGVDAVVDLTGEPIAAGRWSTTRKARLRTSRITAARSLIQALLAARERPRVYIQASAVGYYGDTGDQPVDENTPSGRDFLAELCRDWEEPAHMLSTLGVRVVWMRMDIVLGLAGGALPTLAALYQKGLGMLPGDGDQWLSWISLSDAVRLYQEALLNDSVAGPINAAAPVPCRYLQLHQAFAAIYGPGLPGRMPAPLLRLVLGEAAQVLVTGQRAQPAAATALGFSFRHPTLQATLQDLLGVGPTRDAAWVTSRQWVRGSPRDVGMFFTDETSLEDLTPSWLRLHRLSQSTPRLEEGTRIRYRFRIHGFPATWESLVSHAVPGSGLVDEQVVGPYDFWRHRQVFEALGDGTVITDIVRYRLPFGRLGACVAGWLVDRDLARILAYRRAAVARRFPSPSTRLAETTCRTPRGMAPSPSPAPPHGAV